MKNRILITIIAVTAAVFTILVLKLFPGKEEDVTFQTIKVEKGTIASTVTAIGTIEAMTTIKVGTQVSGILKGVYADFNDVVKKGELLAQLDETSLKAQVEQSQAQVDQARAQLNYNESTYHRLKALYEKNLISRSDYDLALFNYENSKGALANAESNLARSNVNLEYATITSPIDGVVLNRAVEEGQTVAASFNTPELFTIVNDLTRMEVKTSVDEADIGKIRDGQRVEFTVDAYPGLKFTGFVSEVRLQPVTTNNVVTYNVILNAPNPDKKLMPGMTASATIIVEEQENTLILSAKAIRFTPDSDYLNKMIAGMRRNSGDDSRGNTLAAPSEGILINNGNTDGSLSEKIGIVWMKNGESGIWSNTVKTGINNGTSVEILSGLNEGDEVIISMQRSSDKHFSINSLNEEPTIPAGMPGHGG